MKYKQHIIGMIIYCSMLVVGFFMLQQENSAYAKIFPGNTAGDQLVVLFFFYITMPLIFGVFFGYILGPLYLYFHMKIIGRKMIYGIKVKPKPSKSKNIFKNIFPVLMAINFAIMLIPYLKTAILYESVFIERPGQVTFFAYIVLLVFTIGPAFGLFSGVWFLEDAGIGYTNREKVKETGEFVEYRSVGRWYAQFLKGYAGIGVIFSVYIIIVEFYNEVSGLDMDLGALILLLLLIIPTPIYGLFASIPTILIFQALREKRVKYMLSQAKKLGISTELEYVSN